MRSVRAVCTDCVRRCQTSPGQTILKDDLDDEHDLSILVEEMTCTLLPERSS